MEFPLLVGMLKLIFSLTLLSTLVHAGEVDHPYVDPSEACMRAFHFFENTEFEGALAARVVHLPIKFTDGAGVEQKMVREYGLRVRHHPNGSTVEIQNLANSQIVKKVDLPGKIVSVDLMLVGGQDELGSPYLLALSKSAKEKSKIYLFDLTAGQVSLTPRKGYEKLPEGSDSVHFLSRRGGKVFAVAASVKSQTLTLMEFTSSELELIKIKKILPPFATVAEQRFSLGETNLKLTRFPQNIAFEIETANGYQPLGHIPSTALEPLSPEKRLKSREWTFNGEPVSFGNFGL